MAKIIAVEFDFKNKRSETIPVEEAKNVCQRGQSCWVDLDLNDPAYCEKILREFGVEHVAIEQLLNHETDGRYDTYKSCIHLSVTSPHIEKNRIDPRQTDLIIGDQFVITLHRKSIAFLEQVQKEYESDFVNFAGTLGFMLYEFWDHLIESYRKGILWIEGEVEKTQGAILATTEEINLGRTSELMHDLLVYRKTILAAREVLRELTSRRSLFVSESTQPFLTNMVGTLERLGSDLTVEREVLAETIHIYLGVMSHRTNRVVRRLTAVSSVFLPLTFLCGVYGMNFDHFPELHWQYGYFIFWAFSMGSAAFLLFLMRKRHWL